MNYRYLGGSGLLVSRISLGSLTFGTPGWGCDEATAHRIMKAYVDGGGNLLDTADIYAGGESENIIGSFLPQIRRDEILIATKSYFPMGSSPNVFGASRGHLIASCEASLRRMKTDYIDLYYIHGPDPVTPLEESPRTGITVRSRPASSSTTSSTANPSARSSPPSWTAAWACSASAPSAPACSRGNTGA